jgi:hypothetical protein
MCDGDSMQNRGRDSGCAPEKSMQFRPHPVEWRAVFDDVDTRVPADVEKAVCGAYTRSFPDRDCAFVRRAFEWAEQCFSGRYDDYQAIDAGYHDFEHTLQGTLCLARLLAGRCAAKVEPVIPRKRFELCLLAILFHDTGYLKKRADTAGTGAKYTAVHVERSVAFAREFLTAKGYPEQDLEAIGNMIRCTGVAANVKALPFRDAVERTLGYALGTADLLGQMAAPDYVEKLPILFSEFAEAGRTDKEHGARFAQYRSADDVLRGTPSFWSEYAWPRINEDFHQLYIFLNDPDGPNRYLLGVQKNLARVQERLKEL